MVKEFDIKVNMKIEINDYSAANQIILDKGLSLSGKDVIYFIIDREDSKIQIAKVDYDTDSYDELVENFSSHNGDILAIYDYSHIDSINRESDFEYYAAKSLEYYDELESLNDKSNIDVINDIMLKNEEVIISLVEEDRNRCGKSLTFVRNIDDSIGEFHYIEKTGYAKEPNILEKKFLSAEDAYYLVRRFDRTTNTKYQDTIR